MNLELSCQLRAKTELDGGGWGGAAGAGGLPRVRRDLKSGSSGQQRKARSPARVSLGDQPSGHLQGWRVSLSTVHSMPDVLSLKCQAVV